MGKLLAYLLGALLVVGLISSCDNSKQDYEPDVLQNHNMLLSNEKAYTGSADGISSRIQENTSNSGHNQSLSANQYGTMPLSKYNGSYGNNMNETTVNACNFSTYNRFSSSGSNVWGSSSTIGNTTFHNGMDSNGNLYSGTSRTIGNMTFENGMFSNGALYNGTSNRIGNITIHNGMDSQGNMYSGTTVHLGD